MNGITITEIIDEIGPGLQELVLLIKKSIIESKNKLIPANNADPVINLWPSRTPKEVLEDEFFYKRAITQPPLMTPREFRYSLKNKKISQKMIDNLVIVSVKYRGFDNKIFTGQVIIHKDLKSSIKKIFERILLKTDFPMTSVFPISMFNWNRSSRNNNCGAFDWRFVKDSDEVSDHSFGAAIDINSVLNPWVRLGLANSPNFPYNPKKKGALHANSKVVKIFKEEGWKWGGDWKYSKDWMHFYRPEISYKYYGKIEIEE